MLGTAQVQAACVQVCVTQRLCVTGCGSKNGQRHERPEAGEKLRYCRQQSHGGGNCFFNSLSPNFNSSPVDRSPNAHQLEHLLQRGCLSGEAATGVRVLRRWRGGGGGGSSAAPLQAF